MLHPKILRMVLRKNASFYWRVSRELHLAFIRLSITFFSMPDEGAFSGKMIMSILPLIMLKPDSCTLFYKRCRSLMDILYALSVCWRPATCLSTPYNILWTAPEVVLNRRSQFSGKCDSTLSSVYLSELATWNCLCGIRKWKFDKGGYLWAVATCTSLHYTTNWRPSYQTFIIDLDK